jgi:hypothetical protein
VQRGLKESERPALRYLAQEQISRALNSLSFSLLAGFALLRGQAAFAQSHDGGSAGGVNTHLLE